MPTHQELPEQFGRYRILKKLGAGGMGAVYLAEDTRMRRKVALKVPHFTDGIRTPVLERFQREARLAGSIDHPNFCAVYDVDEIDGIHFFTMAYVEGISLSERVREGQPWPAAQAVELVRRVALAVGELHSRGIVHRDLKPGNIMVRPSGEPVLMDFGLACSLTSQSERLTGTGQMMGTLAYMPPEQLEGDRKRIGPASDVYSLGAILYELLTGQLPFAGPPAAMMYQIGSKLPEPPSALQPGLDARLNGICLKALAKKPEERFPDTFAFVAALEELHRPIDPDRATLPLPSPSPSLTGRWRSAVLLLVLGGVTMLGLSGGLYFWLFPDQDNGKPPVSPPSPPGDGRKATVTPAGVDIIQTSNDKTGANLLGAPRVEKGMEVVVKAIEGDRCQVTWKDNEGKDRTGWLDTKDLTIR